MFANWTVHGAQYALKTSLKIFKHYKLKPSFSLIKDNKAKDKVGVGWGTNKVCAKLIQSDPI